MDFDLAEAGGGSSSTGGEILILLAACMVEAAAARWRNFSADFDLAGCVMVVTAAE